jgi:hypothetical protein
VRPEATSVSGLSIRQYTCWRGQESSASASSASIRQHTSAYVSIRKHTSVYLLERPGVVSFGVIREHIGLYLRFKELASSEISRYMRGCSSR